MSGAPRKVEAPAPESEHIVGVSYTFGEWRGSQQEPVARISDSQAGGREGGEQGAVPLSCKLNFQVSYLLAWDS